MSIGFSNDSINVQKQDLKNAMMKYKYYKKIAEDDSGNKLIKQKLLELLLNVFNSSQNAESLKNKNNKSRPKWRKLKAGEFEEIAKTCYYNFYQGIEIPESLLYDRKTASQRGFDTNAYNYHQKCIHFILASLLTDVDELKQKAIEKMSLAPTTDIITVKHIRSHLISTVSPKFEGDGHCNLHQNPVKYTNLSTATRHIHNAHSYSLDINLSPVRTPWHKAVPFNSGRNRRSNVKHLADLKANKDTNPSKLSKLSTNNKCVKSIFRELLGGVEKVKQPLPKCLKCDDSESVVKNGTANSGFLFGTTGILKLRKQAYICLNDDHGGLSKDLSLYTGSVTSVISGDNVFTKGIESYLMESYLDRMCYSDLKHDLAKFYRAQIIDKLSTECTRLKDEDLSHLLKIIQDTTDSEFRSAFKSLIPKNKSMRNFVLRCHATYWAPQIKQSYDEALEEGIEVEGDLGILLMQMDGTFKQATGLTLEDAVYKGVLLTCLNQNGEVITQLNFVPVENGGCMITTTANIYGRVLHLKKLHGIKKFIIIICIDNTTTHKHLPAKILPKLQEIQKRVKLSLDVELSIQLRECGWHVTKRWREIPSHSDRALLMKIICTTHLASERGELSLTLNDHFLTSYAYKELKWESMWENNVIVVRKELYEFVRVLSKCVDTGYEYNDYEYDFSFSHQTTKLLTNAITTMGYVSSHFIGKHVFYFKLPEHFMNDTVELNTSNGETIVVELPSLPRWIFATLCIKLNCNVSLPVWQNKKHLYGEYCTIYFLFSCVWNEHDATPLNKCDEFLKRWLREISDETLMTQLANRWNTNPKLWGNANTSELFHSFANNNHITKVPQNVSFKENAVNLIGKKYNDVKKFKRNHKIDTNWNLFDEVKILNLKQQMIDMISSANSFRPNITRLNSPPPTITTAEMKQRGFYTKTKTKHILKHRIKQMNRNKQIRSRANLMEQDSESLYDNNPHCKILIEQIKMKRKANASDNIKSKKNCNRKRSFAEFNNANINHSIISVDHMVTNSSTNSDGNNEIIAGIGQIDALMTDMTNNSNSGHTMEDIIASFNDKIDGNDSGLNESTNSKGSNASSASITARSFGPSIRKKRKKVKLKSGNMNQ